MDRCSTISNNARISQPLNIVTSNRNNDNGIKDIRKLTSNFIYSDNITRENLNKRKSNILTVINSDDDEEFFERIKAKIDSDLRMQPSKNKRSNSKYSSATNEKKEKPIIDKETDNVLSRFKKDIADMKIRTPFDINRDNIQSNPVAPNSYNNNNIIRSDPVAPNSYNSTIQSDPVASSSYNNIIRSDPVAPNSYNSTIQTDPVASNSYNSIIQSDPVASNSYNSIFKKPTNSSGKHESKNQNVLKTKDVKIFSKNIIIRDTNSRTSVTKYVFERTLKLRSHIIPISAKIGILQEKYKETRLLLHNKIEDKTKK